MAAVIPLALPEFDAAEETAVLEVLRSRALGGDGKHGRAVEAGLRELTGAKHALLTTSGTHALELAMLALRLKAGDEVILPSFTFTSTANAIALRGARPVFVDIDPRTWNLDPGLVEAAITPRTRGIVPVHYAGQACDMDALGAIAERRGLWIVEDAAQAIGGAWKGRALGTFGTFGCLSFHQTKNVVAGEGGALLTNDRALAHRSEILREKGTNRSAFLRGEVDKYTWVDVGSSYVISDLLAALLGVQVGKIAQLTARRLAWWDRYHQALEPLERRGALIRPWIHPSARHNAHLYGFLVDPLKRDAVLGSLRAHGVGATFHYVPLHTAKAAEQFGPPPSLPVTDRVSNSLVRLPLYPSLTQPQHDQVVAAVGAALAEAGVAGG